MTVYLERALNLLDRPAGVYEWPTLRWVSWNEAGRMAGEAIPDRPEGPPSVSWVGIDEQSVIDFLTRSPGQHMAFAVEYGCILISLMEPLPTHVRPPLVLVTLHVDQRDAAAELDHLRLRQMLVLTEGIEVAEETLNTGLQLVANSLEALRGLSKVFFDNAEEIQEHVEKDSANKG